MKFKIEKISEIEKTFRVSNIINNFDIPEWKIKETFEGEIDIEWKDWNVWIIVWPSGTGKTTIAKELFPDCYIFNQEYKEKSVIDDMPKNKNIKEITKAFTSVWFASPPSWLKPYSVLSNGEKMRCDLAKAILDEKDLIVFDEFTSVVNREVAKTGSYAIQKAVRKIWKKFIAVWCHSDIIEWLEPDWVYDTSTQRFFFAQINTKDQKLNWEYIKWFEIGKKTGSLLKSIII